MYFVVFLWRAFQYKDPVLSVYESNNNTRVLYYNRKGYSWEGSLYIETRPTQQESPWWEPKITWLFPAFGLTNIALLRKQSIENDAFW